MPERLAARAQRALLQWIDQAPDGRCFLQVHICNTAGTYRMVHHADVDVPVTQLERCTTPEDALRVAATDEQDVHRPLRSAPDLRRGWLIEGLSGAALWDALSFIYPAAAVRWYQLRAGELRAGCWDSVAARQSGMYAGVRGMGLRALRGLVREQCVRNCLRTPVWIDVGQRRPAVGDAVVPCVEACSLFISRAAERSRTAD